MTPPPCNDVEGWVALLLSRLVPPLNPHRRERMRRKLREAEASLRPSPFVTLDNFIWDIALADGFFGQDVALWFNPKHRTHHDGLKLAYAYAIGAELRRQIDARNNVTQHYA